MDAKAAKKAKREKAREERRARVRAHNANHVAEPSRAAGLSPGLSMIATAMKVWSLKGNPRDYVILSEHFRLYDGERVFEIKGTLPEKLDVGDHVFVVDISTDKQPMRPVIVVEDNGATLKVKNPDGEVAALPDPVWTIERSAAYPTAIPGRVTPVHRSQLAKYLGENIALNWWKPGFGRLVPQTALPEQVEAIASRAESK